MKIYNIPQKEDYFACNTYIVENNGEGVVIDAGVSANEIFEYAKEKKINIRACLLTHAHFDHIKACKQLLENGVNVYILDEEVPQLHGVGNAGELFNCQIDDFEPTATLKDGQKITLCGMEFSVMQTSGHTKGSCCYFIEDVCFSGDTLFKDGYGRTDLPSASFVDMLHSLKKLKAIEKRYTVYAGHGEPTVLGKKE